MTNSSVDSDVLSKWRTVAEAVLDHMQNSRRARGLSPLLGVTPLEDAALSLSGYLMTMESTDADHVSNEYTRLAFDEGYTGSGVSVSCFRKAWPMDTPEAEIAGEIIRTCCTHALEDYLEDYGLGVSWSVSPQTPKMLTLCVVLGVGYTDGSGLVINHVNRARKSAGVAPLVTNGGLRLMTRNYIGLTKEPEHDRMLEDLGYVGYAEPGDRVRFAYLGSYAPLPGGHAIPLDMHELAMMVGTHLLGKHRVPLRRPDWQHIGLSIDPKPVLPPHEPRVPSILVESLVAWRLDGDVERPAHFPPSAKDPITTRYSTNTDAAPKPKRRWWPFS